nr:siderochrome-iron transporter [Aspergillus niger CBS 513.88]|eukprot:XP_003188889.1 siderochrome-iron transporter [Aspergillus niger CBS 513.88]
MRFTKEEKTTTETNQEVSYSAESQSKEVTSGHDDGIFSSSDHSQLSLEAQNEKEVETHPDEVTKDAQLGVQKAEAAALVWSKQAVYATYAWIWVCFFLLALNNSISGTVINRAYADFKAAPQVSTASILYSIIGGVLKLPIAKTLNIWGRNRAFTFAFASTPFICTAFTGPLAGESFLKVATWRWAYGVFAIVMPVVFSPLVVLLKYYQRKAESMGLLKKEESGRTTMQSIVHYIHEFDLIGACLLMAAWVLLLLPFSLQQYGRAQYKSAKFIAMVVIGFVLLFVFAAWEKWFTRKHFVRYELLRQRTVLGACIMSAVSYFSFYCWDLYFYDFCIVVFNLSVSMTGYMTQIYNVGSCFWGVVFGIWIRYTKHFKSSLPLAAARSSLVMIWR